MNKTGFIKKLEEKLGYDEGKCTIISSIIDDHFIVGVNNKDKIKADLKEKLGIGEEEADKIYNVVSETIAVGLKDKILHPFKKD